MECIELATLARCVRMLLSPELDGNAKRLKY